MRLTVAGFEMKVNGVKSIGTQVHVGENATTMYGLDKNGEAVFSLLVQKGQNANYNPQTDTLELK